MCNSHVTHHDIKSKLTHYLQSLSAIAACTMENRSSGQKGKIYIPKNDEISLDFLTTATDELRSKTNDYWRTTYAKSKHM